MYHCRYPFFSHFSDLTSAQKKPTNLKAQGDLRYIPLEREWVKGNEVGQVTPQKFEDEQTNGESRFMLQRWQRETMSNQPYHNVDAVREQTDRGNTHQTSMKSKYDSSIEYFER